MFEKEMDSQVSAKIPLTCVCFKTTRISKSINYKSLKTRLDKKSYQAMGNKYITVNS